MPDDQPKRPPAHDILHNGGLDGVADWSIFRLRHPRRESKKIRTIRDWHVLRTSEPDKRGPLAGLSGLCIVGAYKDRVIRTSAVLRAPYRNRVETANCIYVLQEPNRCAEHMEEDAVNRHFIGGFTEHWREAVEREGCEALDALPGTENAPGRPPKTREAQKENSPPGRDPDMDWLGESLARAQPVPEDVPVSAVAEPGAIRLPMRQAAVAAKQSPSPVMANQSSCEIKKRGRGRPRKTVQVVAPQPEGCVPRHGAEESHPLFLGRALPDGLSFLGTEDPLAYGSAGTDCPSVGSLSTTPMDRNASGTLMDRNASATSLGYNGPLGYSSRTGTSHPPPPLQHSTAEEHLKGAPFYYQDLFPVAPAAPRCPSEPSESADREEPPDGTEDSLLARVEFARSPADEVPGLSLVASNPAPNSQEDVRANFLLLQAVENQAEAPPAVVKRKRGRPRKYPRPGDPPDPRPADASAHSQPPAPSPFEGTPVEHASQQIHTPRAADTCVDERRTGGPPYKSAPSGGKVLLHDIFGEEEIRCLETCLDGLTDSQATQERAKRRKRNGICRFKG